MVEEFRLRQLLSARTTPARMVDALIAEANARGGVDNITAVVVRIHSSSAMTTGSYPTQPNVDSHE
jgi:serine/threonine protein phosphatase PrpC